MTYGGAPRVSGQNRQEQDVRQPTHKNAHRRRDSEAARSAILRAATEHFAATGYEYVTLRDIANDAGLDVALISRYFMSKEKLFEAAMIELLDPTRLIEGDRSTFGRRHAETCLDIHYNPTSAVAPMIACIRAAASPITMPTVQRLSDEYFTEPFARWLGGERAEVRAYLIASLLSGAIANSFISARYLADADARGEYVDYLAAELQSLVDGTAHPTGRAAR